MEYFYNFSKLSYIKGDKPDGCILCLLRDKDTDVVDTVVMEADHFFVSINLYPYNPGHLIVFPRKHMFDIREFSESEEKELTRLQKYCLTVLDRLYKPTAYNIGYNMHLDAGASIDHIHLHIIPRFPHEIGMTDIIAGKKVLVENPMVSRDRLQNEMSDYPFSIFKS